MAILIIGLCWWKEPLILQMLGILVHARVLSYLTISDKSWLRCRYWRQHMNTCEQPTTEWTDGHVVASFTYGLHNPSWTSLDFSLDPHVLLGIVTTWLAGVMYFCVQIWELASCGFPWCLFCSVNTILFCVMSQKSDRHVALTQATTAQLTLSQSSTHTALCCLPDWQYCAYDK